eukprot:5553581-Pyramimonas_sp.AAC.1
MGSARFRPSESATALGSKLGIPRWHLGIFVGGSSSVGAPTRAAASPGLARGAASPGEGGAMLRRCSTPAPPNADRRMHSLGPQ